jgi:hypothetical protein
VPGFIHLSDQRPRAQHTVDREFQPRVRRYTVIINRHGSRDREQLSLAKNYDESSFRRLLRLPQPLHCELDIIGLDYARRLDRRLVSIFRVAFEIVPRQLSGGDDTAGEFLSDCKDRACCWQDQSLFPGPRLIEQVQCGIDLL